MIRREQVQAILDASPTLSASVVAGQLGVSPSAVVRIRKAGPDALMRYVLRDVYDVSPKAGPKTWCTGCGAHVIKPCVKCAVASIPRSIVEPLVEVQDTVTEAEILEIEARKVEVRRASERAPHDYRPIPPSGIREIRTEVRRLPSTAFIVDEY
jgi:hypothetical protein